MCGNKCLYNFLLLLLLCGLWCVVSAADDRRRTCPQTCICFTHYEKKIARCEERNLTTVPFGLRSDVQKLYLFYNDISTLKANTFKLTKLTKLTYLDMEKCQIRELDGQAFNGLRLLETIHLPFNEIQKIHSNTFRETTSLVSLNLDKNPIEILEDGLFTNLTSLRSVFFSSCKIRQIGPKTFDRLPNLTELYLNNNQLHQISLPSFKALRKLKFLHIYENPWNCNCRLKDVRDWFVFRFGNATAPKCEQPPDLRGKSWNEIESNKFKYKPQILYLSGNETVTAGSEDVILSCTASGDPLPEIYWTTPSGKKLISNVKSTKYSITESKTAEKNQLVVNLTISNIQTDDAGTYTCVADKHEDIPNCANLLFLHSELFKNESLITTIVNVQKSSDTKTIISVGNTKDETNGSSTKSSGTSLKPACFFEYGCHVRQVSPPTFSNTIICNCTQL